MRKVKLFLIEIIVVKDMQVSQSVYIFQQALKKRGFQSTYPYSDPCYGSQVPKNLAAILPIDGRT